MELACEAGKRLEYGASVAGGIPAIIGIQEGLAGDRIYRIAGVLNGTCNFILTKMEATGASFASALKEAQELGYAEADPRNDVEGYDARAKLVILTQAGLRARVRSEQIPCWPISSVEAVDFAYARELNCTIRQISLAKKETENGLTVHAFVRPALVPVSSLVAHVEGSKNLVMATGQYAGQMVFSGFGAGGDPTAVAVVSDLYSIARSGRVIWQLASGRGNTEGGERAIHRALLFALRCEGSVRDYCRGGDRVFTVRNRYRRGSAEAGISPFRSSVHHYAGNLPQRDAGVRLARNQPARLPRGAGALHAYHPRLGLADA